MNEILNTAVPATSAKPVPEAFYVGAAIVGILILAMVLHRVLRFFLAPKETQVEKKMFLYPKAIRVWHWSNLAFFLALLTTGLLAWVGVGPKKMLIGIHTGFASIYVFLWTFFIAYNVLGNGKNYFVKYSGWLNTCWKQIRYYLVGMIKGEKHPFEPQPGRKFNPLQQSSYLFVMYLLIPLFIISGILERVEAIHEPMMMVHIYFCTFVSVLFVVGHLYMVLSGDYPSQKVKAMVDGYERFSE